jgi:DNA-binding MurR/RpiR family transcriptional regulator
MATRLALRIQNRLEELAPSERRLAVMLLERNDDPLVYSATELAQQAGVSKATAARLFRSLGYRDFNEVRLEAREERNRTSPIQRVLAPAEAPSGATAAETHLQIEIANLTRTFEELSTDRLRRAAHAIAHASTLWLVGRGAEAGLAEHALLLFARLRPKVHRLSGHGDSLAENLAMLGPQDALLTIAIRPEMRLIEPILDWARTTRLASVAVCDATSAERLRRLGAETLVCHAAGYGVGPSHTAAISMVRMLAIAAREALGLSADRRSELIADIRDELFG